MGATTHSVYTFLAGKLPTGCGYIKRALAGLRVTLTTDTQNRHGSVSVGQAGLVSAACRHEGRALLLSKWLREAELPLSERASILGQICDATDSRDKAIAKLGIEPQDARGRDLNS